MTHVSQTSALVDDATRLEPTWALNLPIKFVSQITLYDEVWAMGPWLICVEKHSERTRAELEPAQKQSRWLESCFAMQRERNPRSAANFLSKYGQFRSEEPLLQNTRQDWRRLKRNGRSLFEKGEWQALSACFSQETDKLTLIAITDFWQEWNLLEIIAEIAGKLTRQTNPILLKSDVDQALNILNDLETHSGAIWATLAGHIRPTYQQVMGYRPETNSDVAFMHQESSQKFNEGIRANLRALIIRAVNRALGLMPAVHFGTSLRGIPSFDAKIDSILGHAYLCMLASFTGDWKRCLRRDCQKLFLAFGKRRKYCAWYCGHIESVRRARK